MIPYSKQLISKDDIDSVVDVLRSEWLTQGPTVQKFELEVLKRCRLIGEAVAFNSATSALHASCVALGLSKGDRLWTVPNTFVASANCALFCGAEIGFVDIDPKTWTMCPEALSDMLKEADKKGILPKIIVPVHFAGASSEMRKISSLAKKYDIRIIEDASHALGGSFDGFPIGACKYSDITVFSFHPVKMITSGEGGMALTGNADLAERMKQFRSHGITRDRSKFARKDAGPWSYQQISLGFNLRLTDISAALGLSQLKKLNDFVSKRCKIAEHYLNVFQELDLRMQIVDEPVRSSWHLFVICLNDSIIEVKSREEIFNSLRSEGIGVNVHYEPVHLQPFYRNFGFKEKMFPNAEDYAKRCISIPIHPGMNDTAVDRVVAGVKTVLGKTR